MSDNVPLTVIESIAERWTENPPPTTWDDEIGMQSHKWEDDARWFAEAYANILRSAGYEIASDYLRRISRSSE